MGSKQLIHAKRGVPTKRQRRAPGAIVEIPVAEGLWAYAQLGESPVVAVLDGVFSTRPDLNQIMELPIAFKCCVFSRAVTKGYWIKIGKMDPRPDVLVEDYAFIQDPITGELSLYHSEFSENGWRKPALLSECIGLERAAVWEASHVEDRIEALHKGTECQWAKSLEIDRSRVPKHQNDLD